MTRTTPLPERMARSTVRDPETGCVNWQLSVTPKGYGKISIIVDRRCRTVSAHRVAYELARGPIPAGLEIDHLCRNRRCCNPDHMEAVTTATNIARSDGMAARNAAKTHCVRGHLFDDGNTSWRGMERVCRKCNAIRGDQHRARQAARSD